MLIIALRLLALLFVGDPGDPVPVSATLGGICFPMVSSSTSSYWIALGATSSRRR